MPPTFEAEAELRRHGSALRDLANALLGNRDAADDVVQATWLRALERPPQHDAAPGGWLATVVRNFARRWRRGERRRLQREALAARSEAVPDAAAVAAREELLQRVVDGLRSLPQPYRGALWMRYFEDLPPAVIAARTGVPVATVKSRLQRGLAQLRTKFDREGGEATWRAGLAAAFGIEGGVRIGTVAAAGVLGVLTMTTKAKLVVTSGILVLMLVGTVAWWPDASAPGSSPPRDGPARGEAAHASLAAGQAATLTVAEEQQRVVAGSEAAVAATTGTLVVRAIGTKGTPATGETLVVARKGEGAPFGQRLQRTDAAGEARFEGLPPGTMIVQLLQHPHSTAAAIRAGEVTELEFVLPNGLTVRGLVIDAEERPLAGAEVALFQFDSESTAVVATTDADGRFTLRHVHPMSYVGARTGRHAASRWQMLHGTDGVTVDVVIPLLDAGGVVEGIVLGPDGRPVRGANVQVGKSQHEGPFTSLGFAATAVPGRTGEDGRFRAIGLAAGEQPVFVRAAGLVPWRGACSVNEYVTTAMRIELTNGVTCTGFVRDATGAPVSAAIVRPRGLDGAYWCWTETSLDGAFTMSGLAPGTIELRASHDELGKGSTRVAGEAGAIVSCELVITRGIELRGRVLDAAGAPLPGVSVWATAESGGSESSQASTDAAGRFVLANCPEGLLRVTADLGKRMTRREHVDPRLGELELRLPGDVAVAATVRIRGRLVGPDGQPLAGALVSVDDKRIDNRREQATTADGSFELGPVPPGTWQVYIPPQAFPSFVSGWRELAANEVWDLGRIQLIAGGTATVQVRGAPQDKQLDFYIRNRDLRPFGGRWLGDGLLRTDALAPGEYFVQVWCDGIARRLVPFTIRAGEETRVETRLEPGIRQRLELVRSDGAKVSSRASHSLFQGDDALIHHHLLYWRAPPVYALDGAMTADLWLAPGSYRIEAKDEAASGHAQFTVGEREGAPVRIVLR